MRRVPAGLLTLVLAASLCSTSHANALFPTPSETSFGAGAFRRPIAASSTCDAVDFCADDNVCVTCNGTCLYGVDPDISPFTYSLIGQPQCLCPAEYPIIVNTSACCVSAAGASCVARLSADAHPATLANDASSSTYFQSAQNEATVNVTIDLLLSQEVIETTITFARQVPIALSIERSSDGETFTPYQYFAEDCSTYSMANNAAITSTTQVVCSTNGISPRTSSLTFTTIPRARLDAAGVSTYYNSADLVQFIRARYLRFAFKQYYTSDTAVDQFGQPIATEPFYRVENIRLLSRADCNGHASSVVVDAETPMTVAAYGSYQPNMCDCQHNTQGTSCDECQPLYHGKPWARGLGSSPNECVACECNGHADACVYDAALDSNPSSRTQGNGGRCLDCQHHTTGPNCDRCAAGFYRNPAADITAPDACLPCGCYEFGVTDGNLTCDVETGQCQCVDNAAGRTCDSCALGYFGLNGADDAACVSCDCNNVGTLSGQLLACDNRTGQSCDSECESCYGPGASQCNACYNVLALDGSCQADCPAGSYNDSNVCKSCHAQCGEAGCTGPNANQCLECANYVTVNGTCIAACAAEFYVAAGRTCRACDPLCTVCSGPNANQCSACSAFRDGDTCVAECPIHKYADANNLCQPCSSQCDLAAGCSGPNPSQCKKCAVIFDTQTGQCSDACPALYYNDTTTSPINDECRPCSSLCDHGCDGPTASDCIGDCAVVRYNEQCLNVCPSNTYNRNGVCLDCHDTCHADFGCYGPRADQCNTCSDNTILFNETCVYACPTGYFRDPSDTCQPCHSTCDACWGGLSTQCSHCKALAYGNRCVATCPVMTFSISRSQALDENLITEEDEDDDGTNDTGSGAIVFDNLSDFVCLDCHAQCETGCTGPEAHECSACRNVEYNGVCMASCPAMTVEVISDNTRQCVDCDTQCLGGCWGEGPHQCDACRNVNYGSTCLEACPSDSYRNGTTCLDCHAECSTTVPGCTGPTVSDCYRCEHVYIVAKDECAASCPYGTFRDPDNNCQVCNEQCNGCTGAGPNNCIGCRGLKYDGVCLEECPRGTANPSNSTNCERCHVECAFDCYGPGATQCIADPAGNTSACSHYEYHSEDGIVCVAGCDQSISYLDTVDAACYLCHPQCAEQGCSGPLASDCNTCTHYRLGATCVSTCPPSHYADSERVCQPCHAECTAEAGIRQCGGPTASDCTACANVMDNGVCRPSCRSTSVAIDATCYECHAQCEEGCFGTLATECYACANWELDGQCIASCPTERTFPNSDDVQCEACNAQCVVSSTLLTSRPACSSGTGPDDCTICLHVRQDGTCLTNCSRSRYVDQTDLSTALGGVCRACHSSCAAESGCFGPSADQCNDCRNVYDSTTARCTSSCPSFTYQSERVCLACDSTCRTGCTGAGPTMCLPQLGATVTTAATLGCKNVSILLDDQMAMCMVDCPVGTYADARNLCQPCSSACASTLGCTGPSEHECLACPSNQFVNGSRLCERCSSQCVDGCSGPTAADCFECRGARYDGTCVPTCNGLNTDTTSFFESTDAASGEAQCLQCHAQCVNGDNACDGTTAGDCLLGCQNFVHGLTGACLAQCSSNSFISDNPYPNTCTPCNALCTGGCRGAGANNCVDCTFAYDNSVGACVSACPGVSTRNADSVCECPAESAFRASNGSCLACNIECAAGCTGPGPNQCADIPTDCRVAALVDTCVAACPAGMRIGASNMCECRDNHYINVDGDGCSVCDEQCFDGCTGPLPSQCTGTCRNVRSGNTCVATCPDMEAPDADNVCGACAAACAEGCAAPADATQCTSCALYQDGDSCVEDCPEERSFLDQGMCVAACPEARPYYNDTRLDGTEALGMPQRCVSSCAALNNNDRLSINTAYPYRCSSESRVLAEASTSGENADAGLIAAVVCGAILFILIVIIVVVLVMRSRSGSVAIAQPPATPAPPPSKSAYSSVYDPNARVHQNAMYMPSPNKGHDTYAFHPTDDYMTPDMNINGDAGSYMEVTPSRGSINAYNLDDSNTFDEDDMAYAMGTGTQSTRM
ncbi:uncharacterized protein MONBRDRAFT_26825 [Monosiga brevicollis MX1]|uniref:Uncharacterized protein n=1 Tax=Monosiga brevicollis TaxID=81824 RepID=A9V3M5_MONBE|nr:uncharacterized protein MONBRDRAFT_26825 [Monosiga brevicollis MX1]EDQ87728.1 predicted protein [Monosiga brevicollis MX1]|eukprot:XP_001747261.1 hypothetical protein [Monosiga brevicollis MX1]